MWFRKKMKTHMFIIIRYSLASADRVVWRIGKDHTFEEYTKSLFDTSRLDLHEKLFKTVTLPSIIALKRTTNLTLLVLTSNMLPSPYLDRIKEMLQPYEWAKLYDLPPNKKSTEMIEECLQQELSKYNKKVCYSTTRLDDDDALAPNFCEELEKYLHPSFQGFCISFPKGYVGVYGNSGFESFYDHYVPKVSMGLTYIDVYDPKNKKTKSIYGVGDHMKVDLKCPTILDSIKPMYLRTIHAENDSQGKLSSAFKKISENKEIIELFSITHN